jgi:hypothetical protein
MGMSAPNTAALVRLLTQRLGRRNPDAAGRGRDAFFFYFFYVR